jgi:hypothetical protein
MCVKVKENEMHTIDMCGNGYPANSKERIAHRAATPTSTSD